MQYASERISSRCGFTAVSIGLEKGREKYRGRESLFDCQAENEEVDGSAGKAVLWEHQQ